MLSRKLAPTRGGSVNESKRWPESAASTGEIDNAAFFHALNSYNKGHATSLLSYQFHAITGGLYVYHEKYGTYPKGDNTAVARALLGGNPDQPPVISYNSPVGPNREFVDVWHTPYFIRVSDETIDIRSAGPDRMLWTADDLAFRDKTLPVRETAPGTR
jgi:hypothetical protein